MLSYYLLGVMREYNTGKFTKVNTIKSYFHLMLDETKKINTIHHNPHTVSKQVVNVQ